MLSIRISPSADYPADFDGNRITYPGAFAAMAADFLDDYELTEKGKMYLWAAFKTEDNF